MTVLENDFDHLMTQKEVAAMLRVSPSTITALRNNGSLPHVRIGKRVLFRKSTVQAFMQSNEVTN